MDKIQEEIQQEVLNWYATSEHQGTSSKSLAMIAVNKDGELSYPSDNSDFRRCVMFENECPRAFEDAKEKIINNKEIIKSWNCDLYGTWRGYFDNWDRMKSLLTEQLALNNDGLELYNLMHHIQEDNKTS